jgi:hypothetical protein
MIDIQKNIKNNESVVLEFLNFQFLQDLKI